MTTRAIAAIVALCMTVIGAAAQAADYPVKPIKAIVPTAPGGAGDVFMRLVGEEIQKRWGKPVIVENRPGGNLNIAARICAEAPNDGHTICILAVEALVYNQFLYKKIPFDPAKDFEPITKLFSITQALVVNSTLRVNSIRELAALSNKKPGTLSYIAPSISLMLLMEKFKKETGADLVRVPFRGGSEVVTAVLSGTTPVAFSGLGTLGPYIRAGKMIGLAVDSTTRSTLFPEIQTLTELGYPSNLSSVYFGLVAPSGTPKAIISKLRDEIVNIANEPGFRRKHLIERGLEPILNTPEEFGQLLKQDRASFERVVMDAGLQPQ